MSRYFLSRSTKPGTDEQGLKGDNYYCSYLILGEEPQLYCCVAAFKNFIMRSIPGFSPEDLISRKLPLTKL